MKAYPDLEGQSILIHAFLIFHLNTELLASNLSFTQNWHKSAFENAVHAKLSNYGTLFAPVSRDHAKSYLVKAHAKALSLLRQRAITICNKCEVYFAICQKYQIDAFALLWYLKLF